MTDTQAASHSIQPNAVPASPAAPNGDRFADVGGGVRLCYRTAGPATGRPVLLIAGLALHLTSWPAAFVDGFAAAGCRVVMPDNRDAGLSSRGQSRPPSTLRQLLGLPTVENYSIDDMADDMARLLQQLSVDAAHVVGMSMGGMIAQTLAARHPDRVASLTSIFSNTGARRFGQPSGKALWLLATASVPRSEAQAVAAYTKLMHVIGDPASPGAEAAWAAYASQAWARDGQRANSSGAARQIGAIQKSGDRTEQLRRITAPTLVLHGDIDHMVHPSGGKATADTIPGARFVVVPGMRHQIDTFRSPYLTSEILAHIRAADALRRRPDAGAAGIAAVTATTAGGAPSN